MSIFSFRTLLFGEFNSDTLVISGQEIPVFHSLSEIALSSATRGEVCNDVQFPNLER